MSFLEVHPRWVTAAVIGSDLTGNTVAICTKFKFNFFIFTLKRFVQKSSLFYAGLETLKTAHDPFELFTIRSHLHFKPELHRKV